MKTLIFFFIANYGSLNFRQFIILYILLHNNLNNVSQYFINVCIGNTKREIQF